MPGFAKILQRFKRRTYAFVLFACLACSSLLWALRLEPSFLHLPLRIQHLAPCSRAPWLCSILASRQNAIARVETYPSQSVQGGCQTPEYEPFGPDALKHFKILPPFNCPREPRLTYVSNGRTLVVNQTLLDERREVLVNCTLNAIIRESEARSSFSGSVVFKDNVTLQADFVRVKCKTRTHVEGEEREYIQLLPVVAMKQDEENALEQRTRQWLEGSSQKTKGRSQPLLNVVMVGIDSVARLNMMRHCKKTRHILLNRMNAIDLYNYNKVGVNTFPNLLPLMTGMKKESLKERDYTYRYMDTLNITFLFHEFRNAGYRTLFAEDWPQVAIFNYLKKGFKDPPAQFYYRTLANAKVIYRGLFDKDVRCFGTYPNDELILNYTLEFQRLFRDKPHFVLTFLSRSTHDDLNGASQVDDYHARYLSALLQEDLLNNTLFIFFSDHGIRWGSFRSTPQGAFEDSRPFVLMAFPPWFHKERPELVQRVQENAARLVTPFDMHVTLRDVLYRLSGVPPLNITTDNIGISLFDEIPADRECVDAGIPLLHCVCTEDRPGNPASDVAQRAGKALVTSLNAIVAREGAANLCHSLHLHRVTSFGRIYGAEQYVRKNCSTHGNTQSVEVYRVKIVTKPGEGEFEVSVFRCDPTSEFNLYGKPDRQSRYGNTSRCVKNSFLRPVCYCKNNG